MESRALEPSSVERLRGTFGGEIITPPDPRYDESRRVWNAMIDRRPALVARPLSVPDVAAVVTFAREHDATLAVRCGGHSGPGFSTCDGGVVLDLSRMNGVRVDPERRTATVAGGALLGDLDRASQAHGLATTAGVVSHTGVAGLTLGGGVGRLMRKHGLTIDNLISVEIVTASGDVVRAGEDENAELFWGLRGAGHNFGVATSFEFRLHPVGPNVAAGMALYPMDQALDVVGTYREWAAGLDDDFISGVAFITVPRSMPFPEELAGSKAVQIIAMNVDPDRAGELGPIAGFGSAAFQMTMPMPYLLLQQAADEAFKWGQRNYVKGGYLQELSDAAVSAAVKAVENAPSPRAEVDFLQIGGAIPRVAEDATAFTGRSNAFMLNIANVWHDAGEDGAEIAWTRDAYEALSGVVQAGNYVNLVEDLDADVGAIYGKAKFARLQALKREWDPTNLFRLNQNIKPS